MLGAVDKFIALPGGCKNFWGDCKGGPKFHLPLPLSYIMNAAFVFLALIPTMIIR